MSTISNLQGLLSLIMDGDSNGAARWVGEHLKDADDFEMLLTVLPRVVAANVKLARRHRPGFWAPDIDEDAPQAEAHAIQLVVAALNDDIPGMRGVIGAIWLSPPDHGADVLSHVIGYVRAATEGVTHV